MSSSAESWPLTNHFQSGMSAFNKRREQQAHAHGLKPPSIENSFIKAGIVVLIDDSCGRLQKHSSWRRSVSYKYLEGARCISRPRESRDSYLNPLDLCYPWDLHTLVTGLDNRRDAYATQGAKPKAEGHVWSATTVRVETLRTSVRCVLRGSPYSGK